MASAYLFRQSAKLARERDDLSRERNSLTEEMAAWRRQVDDIVSPRTKVITMVGDETPQANAKVFWDTKTQTWVTYVSDLPAPPSDKDYQLWYVTKNAKISAAVFRTDEQGRTVLKLTLPPDAFAGRFGRYCGDTRTEGRLSSTHRQVLSQSQHLIAG